MNKLELFETYQGELDDENVAINFPDLCFQLLFGLSVLEMSCGFYVDNFKLGFKRKACKFDFQIGKIRFIYPCDFTVHFKEISIKSIFLPPKEMVDPDIDPKGQAKVLPNSYRKVYEFLLPYANDKKFINFLSFFDLIASQVETSFSKDKGLFRFLFTSIFNEKIIKIKTNQEKKEDFSYKSIFSKSNTTFLLEMRLLELADKEYRNVLVDEKVPIYWYKKIINNIPDEIQTIKEAEKWLAFDERLNFEDIWTEDKENLTDDELVSIPENFVSSEDDKERRKRLIELRKYKIQLTPDLTRDQILKLEPEQVEKIPDGNVWENIKIKTGLDTREQVIILIGQYKEFHIDMTETTKLELWSRENIYHVFDSEMEILGRLDIKKALKDTFGQKDRDINWLLDEIENARNLEIESIKKPQRKKK